MSLHTEVSKVKFQGKTYIHRRLVGKIPINGKIWKINVHHPIAFESDIYAVQVSPNKKWWRDKEDNFTQVHAKNNKDALKKGIEEFGLEKKLVEV